MNRTEMIVITGFVALGLAAAGIVWAASARQSNPRQPSSGSAVDSSNSGHKQLYTCGMHPQVVQDHPGTCPICHMKLTPMRADASAGTTKAERKILYWWDPMLGPSSISDHPGKSAMGMDMVPVYADAAGPEVHIDPTVVQNMGVRTAAVTRGPLAKTVRTVGLLKLPDPGLHDVALKIGGWIDKLYADQEGMHVEAGQPLFELYSQDLQVAEQELMAAVRAEQSIDPRASPTVRQEAQRLIDSAKQKLRLWDIAEQDIEAIATAKQAPRDVAFRSPATGHLEEKMVVQGSAVQAGMKLMRIADHSKMWLEAQVYEEQLPMVKLGQRVEATVDGLPGKTFKGPITFIYPHVEHMTRTLTVRVTLDNPGFELKPGMYAAVNILAQPLADAIQVPREAVIDTGMKQIAFVAVDEGRFDPRKVRMGVTGDDDMVQIIEGLAPGETVVTSGQFLMDVESRTTEAIQKLRQGSVAKGSAGPANMQPMAAEGQAGAKPSTAPTALSVVFCPMAKAEWMQPGETVANPYMGTKMLDSGTVKKQVGMPPTGAELAAVVQAYLDVAKGLDADKLDADAVKALKGATDKLAADKYAPLRQAIGTLAAAKDLAAAREAFKTVSAQLIANMEPAK